MPRGGAEHTLARREEIITACEQLYLERDFHDVTIKDIGARTTFTRTSIYNYFETKEEIFLALLCREYLAWAADLEALAETASGGAEALAEGLAATLDRRETMLRLMSTSLFEMEAHSRVTARADLGKRSRRGALGLLGERRTRVESLDAPVAGIDNPHHWPGPFSVIPGGRRRSCRPSCT